MSYIRDKLRIQMAKGANISDANTGGTPFFVQATDIELDLLFIFNGSPTDASSFASVTVQVKPAANIDASPVMGATVTPSSSGWNSNPANNVGDDVVPVASYSGGGSYTIGVQTGAQYTWTRGANDLTLVNGATTIAGSNLVPTGQTYTLTGPNYVYSLSGLTAGAIYFWQAGSTDDKGTTDTNAGGFFISSTTSESLLGNSASAVTAQVYATTTGQNIVPGAAYSGTTYTQTGLTPGQVYLWTKGANDTGCGALTSTGLFVATSATVLLQGSNNTTITATVQPVYAVTQATFTATQNTLTLTGLANEAITSQIVGNVSFAAGTDQHVSVPFTNSQTNIVAGNYFVVASAVTSGGDKLTLGWGAINITDEGTDSTSPSSPDLVPSGASYDGSGNYTLTGLTAGQVYYWQKNADDLTAPGLTSSGSFLAAATSVVLTGTASTSVTAVVYAVSQSPFTVIKALGSGVNFVTVSGLTLPFTPTRAEISFMSGSGGAILVGNADKTTLTSAGATFNFSGATTDANSVAICKFFLA